MSASGESPSSEAERLRDLFGIIVMRVALDILGCCVRQFKAARKRVKCAHHVCQRRKFDRLVAQCSIIDTLQIFFRFQPKLHL